MGKQAISGIDDGLRKKVRSALRILALTFLLVLPATLGNLAAYTAMITLLLALIAGRVEGAAWSIRQAGVRALFLAFALVATAFLANGSGESIASFIPLLLIVPAAMLFWDAPSARGSDHFATFALVGAVFSATGLLYQAMVLGAYRPPGFENSPIHAASEVGLLGFLALGGLMGGKQAWRLIYLLGPMAAIVAALLTGTRAAVFTLIALAVLAIPFVYAISPLSRWIKALATLAAIAGAAGVSYLAIAAGHDRMLAWTVPVGEFLSGQQVSDSSSSSRVAMWIAGLQAFTDAPIFGSGWHRQMEAAMPYLSAEVVAQYQAEGWAYLHNEAISMAVSAGVFGIGAFILIMLHPVLLLRAAPKDSQRWTRLYFVFVLVLGFGTAGLTDVYFMVELPKTMLCTLPMMIILMCRDPQPATAQ